MFAVDGAFVVYGLAMFPVYGAVVKGPVVFAIDDADFVV